MRTNHWESCVARRQSWLVRLHPSKCKKEASRAIALLNTVFLDLIWLPSNGLGKKIRTEPRRWQLSPFEGCPLKKHWEVLTTLPFQFRGSVRSAQLAKSVRGVLCKQALAQFEVFVYTSLKRFLTICYRNQYSHSYIFVPLGPIMGE